jgi:hypothetical protein
LDQLQDARRHLLAALAATASRSWRVRKAVQVRGRVVVEL